LSLHLPENKLRPITKVSQLVPLRKVVTDRSEKRAQNDEC